MHVTFAPERSLRHADVFAEIQTDRTLDAELAALDPLATDGPEVEWALPEEPEPAFWLPLGDLPLHYEVTIDPPLPGALRTTVRLDDRYSTVLYTLGPRGKGGKRWAFGFTEYAPGEDGTTVTTPVSAAEVIAIAREVGRENEVIEMVEAVLGCTSPRNARRLRAEVAAGRNLERVALPRIQVAIMRRLAEGITLSELSERGGFVSSLAPNPGKHDTSWLQRRAGLIAHVCRTGKRRVARTADYDVFVMLVRAVGGDPVDFGV